MPWPHHQSNTQFLDQLFCKLKIKFYISNIAGSWIGSSHRMVPPSVKVPWKSQDTSGGTFSTYLVVVVVVVVIIIINNTNNKHLTELLLAWPWWWHCTPEVTWLQPCLWCLTAWNWQWWNNNSWYTTWNCSSPLRIHPSFAQQRLWPWLSFCDSHFWQLSPFVVIFGRSRILHRQRAKLRRTSWFVV